VRAQASRTATTALPANGQFAGSDSNRVFEALAVLVDKASTVRIGLRLQEAATALGVSRRTLWTWTKEGKVPHARIGDTTLYSVDVLREWLRENSRAAGPGANDGPAGTEAAPNTGAD
jgi:excisionase family DNA binding protein